MRAVLHALRQQQQPGALEPLSVFLSCFSLKDPSDVHRALHAACLKALPGALCAAGSARTCPCGQATLPASCPLLLDGVPAALPQCARPHPPCACCCTSAAGGATSSLPLNASAQHAHEQLLALLQSSGARAGGGKRGGSGPAKGRGGRLFVLVLDEVDRLMLKGTEDLYKLFMLPQTPGAWCRAPPLAQMAWCSVPGVLLLLASPLARLLVLLA